jgi:hypothetical protein
MLVKLAFFGTALFILVVVAAASGLLDWTHCGTEGTDAYYECETGEPLDLTPVQDEADTTISMERNK